MKKLGMILFITGCLLTFLAHAFNGWYDVKIRQIELDTKYFEYERQLDVKKFVLECQQLSVSAGENWEYESCLRQLKVHPEQLEKGHTLL